MKTQAEDFAAMRARFNDRIERLDAYTHPRVQALDRALNDDPDAWIDVDGVKVRFMVAQHEGRPTASAMIIDGAGEPLTAVTVRAVGFRAAFDAWLTAFWRVPHEAIVAEAQEQLPDRLKL